VQRSRSTTVVEVHTDGDAFFVAFARASDAIAAAVAGQRALASKRWWPTFHRRPSR
jgi:class 3 adenylate cyclase